MKLVSIALRDFRHLEGEWRAGPFAPGLSVLCAPNETGKSTLLDALFAALFERHTTKAAKLNLRNDRTAAEPEVTLEWAGPDGTLRLMKRFHGRRDGTELTEGTVTRRDDAAEQRLEVLFGKLDAADRMWGALWVRQGAALEAPPIAGAPVRSALETEIGVITGGGGAGRIRAAAAKELDRLVTSRGARRHGPLDLALKSVEAATATLHELQDRRARLEALINGHARLAQLRQLRLRDQPTRRADQAARQARATADALEAGRQALRRAQDIARIGRTEADATSARLAERDRAARHCAQAREEHARALAATETLVAQNDTARTAADQARTRHETAQTMVQAARLAARLARQQKALSEARAADSLLAETRCRLAANPMTRALAEAIEKAGRQRERAQDRLEAGTPLVTLMVEPGAELHLDGAQAPPGERTLAPVLPMTIAVPGVMRVVIDPRIEDGKAWLAGLDSVRSALAVLLAQAGCEDPPAARAMRAAREALEAETAGLAATLAARAPDGLESLADDVTTAKDALALLGTLPDLPSSEAAAEQALAEATPLLRAASSRQADQARLLSAAIATGEAAAKAVAAAVVNAESLRQVEGDAELVARRDREAAAAREAEAARDALPVVTEGQVEAARTTVLNTEGALKSEQAEDRRIEDSLAEATARLNERSGDGLDEQIEMAEAALAVAGDERDAQRLEADALALLDSLLAEAAKQAAAKFCEPVARRFNAWLPRVIPGAAIEIGEELGISGLRREGRMLPLGLLSTGTREQIAILARLAFADVLAQQGQGVPVILDDVLAYSDSGRIRAMAQLLAEAAARMQIIVLTSQDDLADALGGTRLALERIG